MKSESAFKKHHFWFLLGFVPLLTLIGGMMVSSDVGSAIEGRQKLLEDAKKTLSGKVTPKPTALITEAQKMTGEISKKSGYLHERNWDPQKDMYKWPANSPKLLKRYDDLKLKFGDPLPNTEGQFDEFRKPEVYIHMYSSITKANPNAPGTGMADRIAPTQFLYGWQRVLRHVTDFGPNQLTKDQVWMLMEDVWVQRSLLDAVRSINEEMAEFRRVKVDAEGNPVADKDGKLVTDPTFDEVGNKLDLDDKGQPKMVPSDPRNPNSRKVPAVLPTPENEKRKAVFHNRIWSLQLELAREGTTQRLRGTLSNQSDRLQLMGVGNIMTFHVYFKGKTEPMIFRIGGEYLAGKGAKKTILEPVLGPDGKPVKNPDGKDKMLEKVVAADVLAVIPTDDHILPPPLDLSLELARVEQVFDIRTVPVKRIDKLVLGKLDSSRATAQLVPWTDPNPSPTPTPPKDAKEPKEAKGPIQPGGGPLASVIDGNKKRYLESLPFVRRMPVGIVLVIDQTLIQDVLLSFANSPLRFQITQVAWTRFHGSLSGASPGATTGPDSGVEYRPGTINIGGSADPDSRPSTFPMPGIVPRPGNTGGRTSSTVSDSQITSGLVELSIYGIVSLYEKYDAKVESADPKAKDKDPMPKEPMPKDPVAPMPPAPKNPTPGMRRRVRR